MRPQLLGGLEDPHPPVQLRGSNRAQAGDEVVDVAAASIRGNSLVTGLALVTA
jgi:hypothetical protein